MLGGVFLDGSGAAILDPLLKAPFSGVCSGVEGIGEPVDDTAMA
jgi:hypothetical protein